MDQNQTVDNDLQKAIDNITNTTNTDPVFSDPVAAPSSVPEGDTGELDESVGPFPEPPKVEVPAQTPEEVAPFEPINIPELNTPESAQNATEAPAAPAVAPESIAQAPESTTPEINQAAPNTSTGLDAHQVKEAALRDLIPLLGHINMTPSQKFNIYRNIFENLHDYSVLDQAYKAASEIPDETERAESLLYLVESIDKM